MRVTYLGGSDAGLFIKVQFKLLARNADIWRLKDLLPRSFPWSLSGFRFSWALGWKCLFTMWAS